MVQQLNLLKGAGQDARDWPTASDALRWVGLAALCFAVLGLALERWAIWQSGQTQPQARDEQAISTQLEAARRQLTQRRQALASELSQLRTQEATQLQLGTALQRIMGADASPAYSAYFDALSRQADGSLWLTGFSVSADGDALEIRGRADQAVSLPVYLMRLRQEAVFQRRHFAQLQVGSVSAEGEKQAAVNEFVLRTDARADTARGERP